MNEMVYSLKELSWNVIIEVDNVTREELGLSDYTMIRWKLIVEHLSLSFNI